MIELSRYDKNIQSNAAGEGDISKCERMQTRGGRLCQCKRSHVTVFNFASSP